MPRPKVAVVVPVFNRLPKTLRFIEAFRRVEYGAHELVIVDDASTDGTGERLARDYPEVTVLRGNGHLWWTEGTNLGVRYALENGFDYVLTINNDTSVRPDFLTHLVDTAEHCGPCIVGSRIQYLDQPQRVWGVGGRTSWSQGDMVSVCDRDADENELLTSRANPADVELLTGCGTLVPTACYRTVGLYDGRMFPHYHSDSELTLRAAKEGYRIVVDLRSVVYVDESNPTFKRNLFWLGSPVYWRPLLAMHLRHCPRWDLVPALARRFTRALVETIAPRRPGIRTFLRKMTRKDATPLRRAS